MPILVQVFRHLVDLECSFDSFTTLEVLDSQVELHQFELVGQVIFIALLEESMEHLDLFADLALLVLADVIKAKQIEVVLFGFAFGQADSLLDLLYLEVIDFLLMVLQSFLVFGFSFLSMVLLSVLQQLPHCFIFDYSVAIEV